MSDYDFDSFLELGEDGDKEYISPFHMIHEEDDKAILEWLNKATESIRKKDKDSIQKMRQHLEMYKGSHVQNKRRLDSSNNLDSKSASNKLVVGHLYDLTEGKVSQFTRIKEAPEVLPGSDEHKDKIAAKGAKKVLTHLESINKLDYLKQQIHRTKLIMGEAYLMVEWNPYKGDLSQGYTDGQSVLYKDGIPVMDAQGQATLLDPLQARIGEVDAYVEYPWRILLQPNTSYEKVEYGFHVCVEDIETIKKEYPDKAFKGDKSKIYDADTMSNVSTDNQVIVYTFYHRPTKFIPRGFYIKFTKDFILEKEAKSKYVHGDFPWERLTDIDIPDSLRGISRYEIVGDIQNINTNVLNLIMKNVRMTAHNKWVMPKGAAKFESLGSDNSVVQFNGAIAPQLVSAPSLPADVYNLLNYTEDQLSKKFGAGQVSRGTPPQGVTAAVALQFLNEMETERASSDIAKHNIFMQQVYRKLLSVASEYYDPNDGRLLRIMGEDNKFVIKYFESANLSKTYDVVINNGSALPEMKSSKVQRVLEFVQYGGERAISEIGPERLIEALDIGQPDKIVSLMAEAVRKAEAENEIMLNGEGMPLVYEFEDHINHWKVHTKEMQKLSFTLDLDIEYQEALKQHVTLTELAMLDKAGTSPEFQARLATLELFPMFVEMPTPPVSREQQQAEVQGAANRGMPNGTVAAPAATQEDIKINGGKV